MGGVGWGGYYENNCSMDQRITENKNMMARKLEMFLGCAENVKTETHRNDE